MKKIISALVVVSAGVGIFVVGLRAQGIKEGQWSMTMVTKMEGASAEYADAMKEMVNMPPEEAAMMKQMMGNMNVQMGANAQGITTTVTQCVSNDNPVPEASSEEGCTETHSMDGNVVHFEVVCADSKSTGHVTYKGDAMEGEVKSTQMVDGQQTSATIEISGKYVGPCPQ